MHLLQYDLSPYFLWQGHVQVEAVVDSDGDDDNQYPGPEQAI